jgi:5-hydroxyisourate hydrolase-like protein (transthyretin family)
MKLRIRTNRIVLMIGIVAALLSLPVIKSITMDQPSKANAVSKRLQFSPGTPRPYGLHVGVGRVNAGQTFATDVIDVPGDGPQTFTPVTFILIKPDSSIVSFHQLTDVEGRVRGYIYPEAINQTGTYTLRATVSDFLNDIQAEQAFLVQ